MKSILKNGSLRAVAAFATLVAIVFIACISFTSCDSDLNSPILIDQEQNAAKVIVEENDIERTTRASTWYSVSNDIKNRYYNSYRYACNFNTSPNNVQNAPLAIGFYAALNARHNLDYANQGNSTLELLCGQYDWGSYFKRYSSVDEAYFQFDIHRFIKNREYPVVVYAATTKWGSGQIKDNILTVWAVSDDEVKVTKVSEAATPLFGDNNIIILTWEELFDKAIEISSNNTANVAFMHSGI